MRNKPSSSVCTVCRNRKVKCDGRPGGCENCERLSYQCSFSLPEGHEGLLNNSTGTNDLPRRRARLACQPCKAQKARCSGEQPACIRCRHKNIECVYLPSKRTKVAPPPTSASAAPSAAASPSTVASFNQDSMMRTSPMEVPRAFSTMLYEPVGGAMGSEATYENMKADRMTVKRCIDAFFNVLYPSPEYSFIHKAVFLQMWQAGDIDSVLLKAVCGVAARFVPGQTQAGKDQGAAWIDEAQADLLSSFEKPAVVRLQALQLVVLHCQAMRQFRRLLFLFSICTRMAFLLRLNYEDPALPFLAQESRRRLMWSIFVTDTVLGGGIPDFVLCPARKVHIRLPAEEPSFQLDRAVETEPLRPDPSHPPSHTIGLLAYFIRVMDIRDRVLRFTKDISSESIDPSSMANHFQGFEYELERLRNSLPANMAFSAKNLSLRAYSKNSLPRFVLLHVWWHQCHCDLFRFLIPGFRESVSGQMMRRIPTDLSQYCRAQCVAHARSLADIFHLLVTLDQDVPITDAGLVVPAYQCANILSRSQKMPGMAGSFDIKAGVKACLEVTKALAQYNTMAAVISEDIQKLVEYGAPSAAHSRSRTPERGGDPNSHASSASAEMPKYKFSRHNIVDAANVRDDGADLGYRNATVPFSPASEEPPKSSSSAWPSSSAAQHTQPAPAHLQQQQQQQHPQVPHPLSVQTPQSQQAPLPASQQTPQTQQTPSQNQPTPQQTPQIGQMPTLTQQPLPPPLAQQQQQALPPQHPQYQQQQQQAQQAQQQQNLIAPPVDPLQQQVALQQQAYASQNPNAIMSLNETNDWTWDIPMSNNEQTGLDFLFDPLWRIHNQWDVRG